MPHDNEGMQRHVRTEQVALLIGIDRQASAALGGVEPQGSDTPVTTYHRLMAIPLTP